MTERENGAEPGKEDLEAVLQRIEAVDALDMSYLVTVTDSMEMRDMFRTVAKAYQEKTGRAFTIELIFTIDDPNIQDKKAFLIRLKAMREDAFFRKIIRKITVKGPAGTKNIEPNVFSSDVHFELVEK